MLRVLSLGAGVQSTTVLLMSLEGELPPLDCAIFADTGWEPKAVYRHLEWLNGVAEKHGLTMHRVSAGNIRERTLESLKGNRFATLPLHTINPAGGQGILRRQCTSEFKIEPITRKLRELLGVRKGAQVRPDEDGNVIRIEQWFGISRDEMGRMRRPRDKWIRNFYPLLGEGLVDEPNCKTGGARMTRDDCLAWLKRRGYPIPPKSACIGCPYHAKANWRDLRDNSPEEWQDAVEFDRLIRHGLNGVKMPAFLHRDCVPLDEANLSTPKDKGQRDLFDPLGMQGECEGMCGV